MTVAICVNVVGRLWTRVMVYGVWVVWSLLGYARVIGFLAGSAWAASEYSYLESSPASFDVVHLEGT